MKFGKQFETQQVPEWREAYLDYRELKRIVKDIRRRKQDEQNVLQSKRVSNIRRLVSNLSYPELSQAEESVKFDLFEASNEDGIEFKTSFPGDGYNELENSFFRRLDSELTKVNRFYKSQEEEHVNQAANLDGQMEALINVKKDLSNTNKEGIETVEEETKHIKIDIPAVKPTDALALILSEIADKPVLNLHIRKVKRAEEMLQQAFVEFYRGLYMLRNFCSLNIIAFSKVLKKYDKVTGRNIGKKYLEVVENSYIGKSNKVQKLMEKVEVLFTKYFTDSNHSQAMQVLRPEARKERHRITFFLGVFFGLSVALLLGLVLAIRLERIHNLVKSKQYMDAVFPIFSMLAVIVLHVLLYGVNIYFWRRTRINHTFIMELDRKTELQFRDVFSIAFGLSTLALSGMILHLQVTAGKPCCGTAEETIPLMVVVGLFLLLFLPFNTLYRSTRFFFLRMLWHCLCTPFYKVMITDFLLADHLTSQVQALRDFQYVLCYFGSGYFKTRNSAACLKNVIFIRLSFVMAVLPYWCRLMQCLRRWYDERDKMQLYNALKYFSAVLAVGARMAYNYDKRISWLTVSSILSAVTTIYLTYWDIAYDWGLLNRHSENPWLRDKLAINFKFIYYFAMVSNVLLRFAWLQALIPFQHISRVNPKFISLFVACLEVIRRGQWNYFRLENEHFNNVENYRAVKSVPLPFVD